MPGPTENGIRRAIVQRQQSGETLGSISAELHLSYETVKKIWQHWQRKGAIEPNYEQAKQRGTRQYGALQHWAVDLKRQHPGWGAQLILLEIQQAYPEMEFPTIRTLQRWFVEAGVSRSTQVKQVRSLSVKRGQSVHQVWAVDAKENIELQNGKPYRLAFLISCIFDRLFRLRRLLSKHQIVAIQIIDGKSPFTPLAGLQFS